MLKRTQVMIYQKLYEQKKWYTENRAYAINTVTKKIESQDHMLKRTQVMINRKLHDQKTIYIPKIGHMQLTFIDRLIRPVYCAGLCRAVKQDGSALRNIWHIYSWNMKPYMINLKQYLLNYCWNRENLF
jgi:hypothetical protein